MAEWGKREEGSQDDGYTLGSGIKPSLEAARGCTYCKEEGYLVCLEPHYVVTKQVHSITGEERILGTSSETCFGHLCTRCQPARLLTEEKLRA